MKTLINFTKLQRVKVFNKEIFKENIFQTLLIQRLNREIRVNQVVLRVLRIITNLSLPLWTFPRFKISRINWPRALSLPLSIIRTSKRSKRPHRILSWTFDLNWSEDLESIRSARTMHIKNTLTAWKTSFTRPYPRSR